MWKIEWSEGARKELRQLGHAEQKKIIQYLKDRIAVLEDPHLAGKPLTGNLKNLWRYRFGNYRMICHIEEQNLVILVLRVGHRKDIYR